MVCWFTILPNLFLRAPFSENTSGGLFWICWNQSVSSRIINQKIWRGFFKFFQMIPLISLWCCFYQFWIYLSHCTDIFTNNWTKLCSGTLTELCLYCFGQLGGKLVSTKVIRKMPIRKIRSNFNPCKNSKFMNRGNPVTG